MQCCSKGSSTPSDLAALRLAKAKLAWRRAADELLIDAIFDEIRTVRRDGDCAGRLLRQAALAGSSAGLSPAGSPGAPAGAF